MAKVVSGDFVRLDNADFYRIENFDALSPFFMTIVSSSDHWLFVSSAGSLTTGRGNAEHALFPYETVDKIHESARHTGPVTVFRVRGPHGSTLWTPFDTESLETGIERNLYKHVLGTQLVFEEIHRGLGLAFRSTLTTSQRFGFVRDASIHNLGAAALDIEVMDGVRNVLPAGIALALQQSLSSLTDAYKTSELVAESGLATFSLTAAISDRAEPLESLKCAVVWGRGLPNARYTLDPSHVTDFRRELPFAPAQTLKGRKPAYLAHARFPLEAGGAQSWLLCGDVNRGQADVVALDEELRKQSNLAESVRTDVQESQRELARILGTSDAFQLGGDPRSTAHHTANVLFNDMRGGVFVSGYDVERDDFVRFLGERNKQAKSRNEAVLLRLPKTLSVDALLEAARATRDADLLRLGLEYLPLMFSRRHGDPSRPWNRFDIKLRGPNGERLINYEGNWRDIFQNWEALCFSFPGFLPSIIAKFVNASTLDGFNPYRVSRTGIDWEVPEPHSAWANIGYWGDHQVVYLLRLVEWCERFYPGRLTSLLRERCFSYADVPYRIRPYAELLSEPRASILFDDEAQQKTLARERELGSDGRLVHDAAGVLHVTLTEKLAVTMLSKLSNLVIGGGIWLNTQRPEWNDANNALVGYAASMVTLYQLRRYQEMLLGILAPLAGTRVPFSREVHDWFVELAGIYASEESRVLGKEGADDQTRKALLDQLGAAFERYRSRVYKQGVTGSTELAVDDLTAFVRRSIAFIDHSIRAGKRETGLYDAYNLLHFTKEGVGVRRLYDMLEGQVSVLGSGLSADEAAALLDTMQKSALYRADQHSYLLYPVRPLDSYLDRNVIPSTDVAGSKLVEALLERHDTSLVVKDARGTLRFDAALASAHDVRRVLDALANKAGLGELVKSEGPRLLAVYEAVFKHAEFTGRSGRMYGYEGLGCIYWHMVAKLVVATQECAHGAIRARHPRAAELAQAYLHAREGLCFNKSPEEYGAFPMDPYSHTPPFAGAQQPGMTGQVKEVVLSRFGELGLEVEHGQVRFAPRLLRRAEFLSEPGQFEYVALDGTFQSLTLTRGELAFTYCQVPVVYQLGREASLSVFGGNTRTDLGETDTLSPELSAELFARSGILTSIRVTVPEQLLLG